MSSKTNDELKEMVYTALVLDIKNAKDVLTIKDFGELLATCFEQEELNKIATDIHAETEISFETPYDEMLSSLKRVTGI